MLIRMGTGWNDLIFEVYGGGTRSHKVRLQYGGKQYPNVSDGKKLANDEQLKGTGIIHNDIADDFERGRGLYLR